MNRYLEKIAKKLEEKEHDWSPAIVGGLADIPAGAAIGWAGHELGKKFMGGRTALATGLVSGATTAAAADYLQRRAEKKGTLEKKARETPERKHTPGVGRHNKVPDSGFRAKELALGRKVEKEHVDSYQAAEDIAKDHLSELPDYYSRLRKMEHGVEKSANRVKRVVRKYHEHKDDIENVSSTAAQNYLSERKEKHKHKHKKHHKKKHRD